MKNHLIKFVCSFFIIFSCVTQFDDSVEMSTLCFPKRTKIIFSTYFHFNYVWIFVCLFIWIEIVAYQRNVQYFNFASLVLFVIYYKTVFIFVSECTSITLRIFKKHIISRGWTPINVDRSLYSVWRTIFSLRWKYVEKSTWKSYPVYCGRTISIRNIVVAWNMHRTLFEYCDLINDRSGICRSICKHTGVKCNERYEKKNSIPVWPKSRAKPIIRNRTGYYWFVDYVINTPEFFKRSECLRRISSGILILTTLFPNNSTIITYFSHSGYFSKVIFIKKNVIIFFSNIVSNIFTGNNVVYLFFQNIDAQR